MLLLGTVNSENPPNLHLYGCRTEIIFSQSISCWWFNAAITKLLAQHLMIHEQWAGRWNY